MKEELPTFTDEELMILGEWFLSYDDPSAIGRNCRLSLDAWGAINGIDVELIQHCGKQRATIYKNFLDIYDTSLDLNTNHPQLEELKHQLNKVLIL